jgi:CHAT domain-containing protein/tetratricopeptide (TPR) repeat protein
MVVLCLLASAAPTPAQQFPPLTEEGKKAAGELMATCEKAGAIKLVTEPRSKARRIVVADGAKLKEVAQQQRQKFTPAARDALLRYHAHPGAVALLLRLGQEVGDERAVAFGRLFSGGLLEQRLAYREARQAYEQAARLFERLKLAEWRATSLNNLAGVCHDQGDLPQARKLFQQALALRKQLHGDRHPSVATSLNNLAAVCKDQGDLPLARKLLEQALALYKQTHGDRHPDVALSLNNLAVVCHAQRDLPQATRHMAEAALACRLPGVQRERLDDLRADDLTATAHTAARIQRLGWLLASADSKPGPDRLRQASRAYALAAAVLDRFRADARTSQEGKLDQGARLTALVPDRVALAAALFRHSGKVEDLHVAFTAIEQGRGRVFLEGLARARSHQVGNVPASLRAQEADLLGHLRGLDAAIAKENAKTVDKRNADLVKDLYEQRLKKEQDLKQLAARLRKEYPRYAELMYPQPCTLKEARDCLGKNEVAVLFAIDRKKSFAVLLEKVPARDDPSKGVAVFELPGTDAFDDLVGTLSDRDVLRSDRDARELGARLHSLLLGPLAERLQGKDLLIVPDGVLWQLPFELLVEKDKHGRGRYLVENRKVRYAQSLTTLHVVGLWEKDPKRPKPDRPLWALGDPVYSTDDPRLKGKSTAEVVASARRATESYLFRLDRSGEPGKPPPRLVASGAEVRKVADLLKAPSAAVTDLEACERLVKEASDRDLLKRCRYVHFATHGILGSATGRPPSLILSLVGNDGKELLGGVNDGFLQMDEVTHLKLNADLVVLSACRTGQGRLIAAEGVMGLTRSFLYAGSRGVVCSLWSVDDAQTARLMEEMYTRLQEGDGATEALVKAKRKLIAEGKAPRYWAPFILVGK